MVSVSRKDGKSVILQWGELLVGRRGKLRCVGGWLAPVVVCALHVAVFPMVPVMVILPIVYAVSLFKVGSTTPQHRKVMTTAAVALAVSAATAQCLWMIGFDAADAGNPVPFIAQFESFFIAAAVAATAMFIVTSFRGSKHAPVTG